MKKIKKNEHVRFKGSDYRKNDLIIKKGTIIEPNHILAFKTLGLKKVLVKRKPNILFYSTGNELSNNVNINSRNSRSLSESFEWQVFPPYKWYFFSNNWLNDISRSSSTSYSGDYSSRFCSC